MSLWANEKLLPCPYNSSHRIRPSRIANHIIKCRKNYPNADMTVCFFNATHVIPTKRFEAHLLECNSKDSFEREIYRRKGTHGQFQSTLHETQSRNKVLVPRVVNQGASHEDWDNELVQSSYEPTKSILYKNIARQPPPGLGKAGRRNWREKENERVRRLNNGESIEDLLDTASGGNFTEYGRGPTGVVDGISERSDQAAENYRETMQADVPKSHSEGVEPCSRISAITLPDSASGHGTSSNLKSGNKSEQNQSLEKDEYYRKYIKKKLKLRKKLFEISKLQLKRENGQSLSWQEQEKVAKKTDFETELSEALKILARSFPHEDIPINDLK